MLPAELFVRKTDIYNLSNDVGRVKEHSLLDLAVSRRTGRSI